MSHEALKTDDRARAGGSARLRALAASLLLAGIALAVTCGVAEVGFRLAGYSAIYDVYSKPSVFWQHDDRLGWVHEPGASGVYVGPRPFPIEFETPVTINTNGLRGPEIEPREEGEYRVLVLGDSVVAGFEVAYESTFTALLERKLRSRLRIPVRVINGGVRGYGTDQYYLYYTGAGRRLRPDLVIVVHSSNDSDDNITLHRVRRPFGKPAFSLRPDGSLELVGAPTPSYPLCSAVALDADFAPVRLDSAFNRAICQVQTRAADRSALFTFVSQALGRMPGLVFFLKDLGYPGAQRAERAGPPRVHAAGVLPGVTSARAEGRGLAPEWELTTALMSNLARSVRDDGADLFVLIRPVNLAKLDAARLLAEDIDFRQVGIPAHLEFRMVRFVNDAHYNERWHRVVADGLAPIAEAYARNARANLGPGPRPDDVPGRLSLGDLRPR
jgi:hypothetical protein